MDWWHLATVVVLSVALFGEAVGAYCAQKGRFEKRNGRFPFKLRRNLWARLWLKAPSPGNPQGTREQIVSSEFGPVARGLSRFAVALVLLARFAAGQPSPWSM